MQKLRQFGYFLSTVAGVNNKTLGIISQFLIFEISNEWNKDKAKTNSRYRAMGIKEPIRASEDWILTRHDCHPLGKVKESLLQNFLRVVLC